MARRYTYSTSISFGGDVPTAEFDIEVEFSVAWGSPATEVGYMGDPAKYDPGSASEVEDIKVLTIDGKARPWGLGYGYLSDDEAETMIVIMLDRQHDDMIAEAAEVEAGDRDAAEERRGEDRREALREGF